MDLLVQPSRLAGRVAVPGSKSHTIRALVAALLADGESVLRAPLSSADTESVLAAVRALGAELLEKTPLVWRLRGTAGRLRTPAELDLGNSGTGLRLLCAAAALGENAVVFDGDASLRTRPMRPLLEALEALGAHVRASDGFAPLSVKGPLVGGAASVSGKSSQFLSALLFAAPYTACGCRITLESLNEKPYVEITLDWLRRLGVSFTAAADLLSFEVPGKQCFRAFKRTIPADFSTAAFPLGAACVAGAPDGITIANLDFSETQGDKAVFDVLTQMGARMERGADVRVRPATLHGGDFDLNATPDALPLLAAVAATLPGETTRLLNVPQARIKETDRIACMARELAKLGASVEELPDGMIVHGAALHGSQALGSCADHRIVMALAVAALAANSPSRIAGAECAAVTYPGFFSDFRRLGAGFSELA